MPRTMIIVVIGGTGHFGGRICRRLAGEPNTELVVTSRSEANATRFVGELVAGFPDASIRPAYLDQFSANFEDDLRRLSPTIVVHTAGPYQGQDYRVARACIEAGSHYIDLADGREFVEGFSSLNEFALERGLLLVSGASTLPGLTSAVIDSVSGGAKVDHGSGGTVPLRRSKTLPVCEPFPVTGRVGGCIPWSCIARSVWRAGTG